MGKWQRCCRPRRNCPTIEKQAARSGTNCLSDEYTNAVPVYHPGDLVCWRIEAAFPLELDTQGLTLTDFLPADALIKDVGTFAGQLEKAAALAAKDKGEEIRLAAELGTAFRAQYRRAAELARGQ